MSENNFNLKGINILVVEDEPLLLEVMVEELTYAGAHVLHASGGNQAFEILIDNSVDIVLTDIRMANGNGVDLIKKINQKLAPRPLIFVVSGYSEESVEELKELSVEEVIKKPFRWDSIIRLIYTLFYDKRSKYV